MNGFPFYGSALQQSENSVDNPMELCIAKLINLVLSRDSYRYGRRKRLKRECRRESTWDFRLLIALYVEFWVTWRGVARNRFPWLDELAGEYACAEGLLGMGKVRARCVR